MTVTIDPSDMRPSGQRQPKQARVALRQVLLAGIGACALAAFTAGAFSFFSSLADPRAKTARPIPVASAWPDLKDGVPALSSRPGGGSAEVATKTVLNLPRPDEAGAQRGVASGSDVPLRDTSQDQAEYAPPAAADARPDITKPAPSTAAPSTDAAAPPQLVTPDAVASLDAAGPAQKPASAASGRTPPPIENAELVTSEIKTAAVIAPARVAPAIAPSRSESVRAKSGEPSTFVSLPAEPARGEAARVEPAQAEPSLGRADPAKPVPATKAAAARPAPMKPKPVQAAPAKPPAQKPVMQASAAPAQAAPTEADDPEVMGVKIPGGRHVRDGWKSVFGGGTQPN